LDELLIGKEGKIKFYYYKGDKISSKLKVFYNPLMVVNRDFSNIFINEINKKSKKIEKAISLMAATGVRELRWKKELKIKEVVANDLNPYAIEIIKKNCSLNNISIRITQKDARFFDEKCDYLDVDPFGSPLPFLQPIILSRYFKITSTDLSVYCTYRKKSILKYGDFAYKKYLCHLQAIKILIKRVLDFLSFHELGAKPLLSYFYKNHITIFFEKTRKWKERNYKIIDYDFLKNINLKFYENKLKEQEIIASKESFKILSKLKEEAFDGYYYYLPKIYSIYNLKPIKIEKLINLGKEIGAKITKTHFSGEIIKTNLNLGELIYLIRNNL